MATNICTRSNSRSTASSTRCRLRSSAPPMTARGRRRITSTQRRQQLLWRQENRPWGRQASTGRGRCGIRGKKKKKNKNRPPAAPSPSAASYQHSVITYRLSAQGIPFVVARCGDRLHHLVEDGGRHGGSGLFGGSVARRLSGEPAKPMFMAGWIGSTSYREWRNDDWCRCPPLAPSPDAGRRCAVDALVTNWCADGGCPGPHSAPQISSRRRDGALRGRQRRSAAWIYFTRDPGARTRGDPESNSAVSVQKNRSWLGQSPELLR